MLSKANSETKLGRKSTEKQTHKFPDRLPSNTQVWSKIGGKTDPQISSLPIPECGQKSTEHGRPRKPKLDVVFVDTLASGPPVDADAARCQAVWSERR
jgi:hypothetical protein